MERAILEPVLGRPPDHDERLCKRWVACPRHPREELGTRCHGRGVQTFGVRGLDGLEQEALRREGGRIGWVDRYSERGGGAVFAPSALTGPTQIVWMLVNSLIPYSESSRP